ncbi:MAG TPA: transposase [Casimicrobiaceae bacterium]|nr:transposase [Casimicrobiaceae bacterium]
MPRQPRFYYSGAVLHVVQRGNNRAPVFTSAADHRFYLDCLRDASRTHEVTIHAYVLMTNHVHILASPAHERALPRMMQTVGRRYVGRFNFLQRRTGTLWEGRYKATLVDREAYLFSCLRYIELNPVRACMVPTPGDYRWSSHRANAFGDDDPVITPHPSFLALGSTNEERRDTYLRMFGEPLHAETVRAIRDATQFEWALGDAAFREVVETRTGRRAHRLPIGRPVSHDAGKSRL